MCWKGLGGNGMAGEMGLTVVLAIGSIRLNLRSIPHFEWDLGIHHSVGLDPASAALVFVRSPAHFRVSYTPIAARIFLADTPGPTCVNMRRIPFHQGDAALLSVGSGERLAAPSRGRWLSLRRMMLAEILQRRAQAGLGDFHDRLVQRHPGQRAHGLFPASRRAAC